MNFSFDNKTLNMKLYGICIKMNCVLNEALALKVYKTLQFRRTALWVLWPSLYQTN